MRLLHVVTRASGGGTEASLRRLLDFESRRHDVLLAVGPDGGLRDVSGKIRRFQVPHLRRTVSPLSDARALLELRSLIRELQPDVIFTHESKAGVLGAAAAAASPSSVLVHFVHMASFGKGYWPIASWAFRQAERACALRTNYFVFVGRELANVYQLAKIADPRRSRVLRSAIDIDSFARYRPRQTGTQAMGPRHDGIATPSVDSAAFDRLILGAGMLERRKRFDLLLKAAAPVLRENPTTQLFIAGEGPERASLKRLARRLGIQHQFQLPGHVQLPALMGAASVFVHTSMVEGVAQVVVQALAAGVPVVATEVIGLSEVFQAPIVRVARTGLGLTGAIEEALSRPSAPVPLAALRPWHPASVEADYELFLRELEQTVCTDAASVYPSENVPARRGAVVG